MNSGQLPPQRFKWTLQLKIKANSLEWIQTNPPLPQKIQVNQSAEN